MKIRFRCVGAILLLQVVAASCSQRPDPVFSRSTQPNVILIVVDTLRADALSHNGYKRETSPNIDALAARSFVFNNAVTVAASTPPALSAIMTGRLPYYASGTIWNVQTWFGMSRFYRSGHEQGLPESLDTFAEIMKENGYATGGFITNAHLKRVFNFQQGFDHFEEMFATGPSHVPYAMAEEVTQHAMDWLGKPRDQPAFLYVHYNDVHYPYLPPDAYRNHFAFARMPGREDTDIQRDWLDEIDVLDGENAALLEHARGLYDCGIAYTDHWIGKLIDYVSNSDILSNSIIILTADHGEEFLEHGGTTHKGKMYEEFVRVPLIFYVPDRGPGTSDALVRNFDLMPTVLDLCAIRRTPSEIDAVSLRPIIDGVQESLGLDVFANFPERGRLRRLPHQRMLRTEQYKLIANIDMPGQSELYNLQDDPHEQNNLYDTERAIAAELATRLDVLVQQLEQETENRLAPVRIPLRLNTADGFEGILFIRGARHLDSPDHAGLRIQTYGEGSGFLLPTFSQRPGGRPIVRIAVNSPTTSLLRLAYDAPSAPKIRTILKKLRPGPNTLFFVLDPVPIRNRIRIDFGKETGIYEIESIEIIEIREGIADTRQSRFAASLPQASTGPQPNDATEIDPETREQLEALGYIE